MRRKYFLAMAANYSGRDVFRHTFAVGGPWDSIALRGHLATRYQVPVEQVALYHTGRSALAAALKLALNTTRSAEKNDVTATGKNTTRSAGKNDALRSAKPEVATTALTCYAVVEAVRAAGCEPVFVDIDRQTLHFGGKELELVCQKHPNLQAVIVQNNLGIPADIAAIEKCCKKYNIKLVEDLAHSAGVRYADGREAGTVGVAAALSFGKGKSIDTISGGALIWRGQSTALVRQPKQRPPFADNFRARFYPLFGLIMRGLAYLHLEKLFTALLLKLKLIERSADARLSFTMRCTHWQARLALSQFLALSPAGRPPIRTPYFVTERDAVLDKLKSHGFYFDDTWYSLPVSPERYFKKAHFKADDCPVAVEVAQELINFPAHYPKKSLRPAENLIKEYLK